MNKIIIPLIVTVIALAFIPIVSFFTTETYNNFAETEVFQNPYNNLDVGFLGDSITLGVGTSGSNYVYPALISNELNWTFYNYGDSGSRITVQSGSTDSFVERYDDMNPSLDAIFVFGGTNDFYTGTGNIGLSSSTDNTQFYGALNELFTGLETNYPNARIYIITPFKSQFGSVEYTDTNPNSGATLEDYVNAMLNRAIQYQFNVIDLFNDWDLDTTIVEDRNFYAPDGVHLNNNGHRYLTQFIKEKLLEQVINYNTMTKDSFIKADGTIGSLSGLAYTDYIPVTPGKTYNFFNEGFTTPSFNSLVGAYYDETQTYVSGITGTTSPELITIPSGVYFVRLNVTETKLLQSYFYTEWFTYSYAETTLTDLVELMPLLFVTVGISSVLIYVKIKKS